MNSLRTVPVSCACCDADRYEVFCHGYDHEYESSPDQFRMVRCLDCGHIYLNPRPAASEVSRIHPEREYYAYQDSKGQGDLGWVRRLRVWRVRQMLARFAKATLGTGTTGEIGILDVGCSDGKMLTHLRAVFQQQGVKVQSVGVEMSPRAAELARSQGHQILVGRAEEIELPTGAFHLATSFHLVPHLADPRGTLITLNKTLRPGGYLLLDMVNVGTADFDLLGRSGHWGGFHFPRHWNLFDQERLTRLATECGFRPVTCEYYANPVLWILSLHSLGKRRLGSWATRLFPPAGFLRGGLWILILTVVFTALDHLQRLVTGKTASMRVLYQKVSPPGV